MKRLIFLIALFSVLAIQTGWGQIPPIPPIMSYQGVLTDASGNLVPDGNYNLTFKLYDIPGGGTPSWTEAQSVAVSKGIFNVVLGSVTPLDLPFGKPFWLGVTIGGNPELTPRIPLTTAAYSFNARMIGGGSNIFHQEGNVGIGTPEPQQKLHVVGLGRFDLPTGQINISTPGGWPGIIAFSQNGHRRDVIIDDGGMRLLTSSSSAPAPSANGITIDEDGRVGIGTNFPDARLDIDFGATGSIVAGTPLGNGPGWIIMAPNGHRRDIVGDKNGVYIGASSNSGAANAHFQVSEAGNVGIGLPTGVPGNILTVVQNSATDPIADAWTTYSSRRWKTNIKPIAGALAKVQRLRGVAFDWKADGKHDIGLIAEEVGKVIPEVVAYEANGTDAKSVDYPRLVAVLIEAMKEQQKQIAELKDAVQTLMVRNQETENSSIQGGGTK
ncbi:MAG: tail fiber domain-containing protein [candidate division KSB1 bacterium]|nr:tail fiber domain-containing protein [candidate division KSB1 bacterium]MDZ7302356.1 tail fiber domain-containing protein [candidate division KSB1 bacterium]MDZ7311208.1 tail fiber domain-containing protein [candidate division KSB1 bacterium]